MKYYSQSTILIAALLFLTISGLNGQNCEQADRYLLPQPGQVSVSTVTYATTRGYLNETVTLRADIYQLQDDTTTNRPVILLAHGGAFVLGTKAEMADLCRSFAQLGYVCASIEYRLYPFLILGMPDSARIAEIAFNATSDMRAAVRYFKADADHADQYRIDPGTIIVGGLSAGAIMAVHTGFLHEDDEVSAAFQALLDIKGGVEGDTGDSTNQSYNSRVAGVMNLSGAIFDLDWISPSDPPVMSMHGSADDVVPYGPGREGAFGRVFMYGSSALHERAVERGVESYFVGVPGGGHTDIYTNPQFAAYSQEFTLNTVIRIRDIVCLSTSVQGAARPEPEIAIYPNPSTGAFNVKLSEPGQMEVRIYDQIGRCVWRSAAAETSELIVPDMGLAAGLYILQVSSNGHTVGARRIILQ